MEGETQEKSREVGKERIPKVAGTTGEIGKSFVTMRNISQHEKHKDVELLRKVGNPE